MIEALQNYPLLLVIVGGLLSVFSPCCVSTLPIVVGVLSKDSEKDWKVAIYYSIGFMISVGVIGFVVGKLGIMLQGYIFGSWYVYIVAFLLMLIGLQFLGVIDIWSKLSVNWTFNKKSAFLFGLWVGVFSTPCATAIWVMVLVIIANTSGGVFYGFVYGFVHGLMYIVLAYLFVTYQIKIRSLKWHRLTEKGLGVVLIAWGVYLII